MSNVKSLYGGPTGMPERNDQTIEVLRDLLAKAEAGEVIGAVVAVLYHDGLAGFQIGGMIGGYSLLGAVEMAKSDLIEVLRQ